MNAEVPPPLDVDRITETFRGHGVDFVVIGGIAVLAVPVRDGAFRVAGLDDLIRVKRASGRHKDLDDIAALTHRDTGPDVHPGGRAG